MVYGIEQYGVGVYGISDLSAVTYDLSSVAEAVTFDIFSVDISLDIFDIALVAESLAIRSDIDLSLFDDVTATEDAVVYCGIGLTIHDVASVSEDIRFQFDLMFLSAFDAVNTSEYTDFLYIDASDILTMLLVESITVTENAGLDLPIGFEAVEAINVEEIFSDLVVSDGSWPRVFKLASRQRVFFHTQRGRIYSLMPRKRIFQQTKIARVH